MGGASRGELVVAIALWRIDMRRNGARGGTDHRQRLPQRSPVLPRLCDPVRGCSELFTQLTPAFCTHPRPVRVQIQVQQPSVWNENQRRIVRRTRRCGPLSSRGSENVSMRLLGISLARKLPNALALAYRACLQFTQGRQSWLASAELLRDANISVTDCQSKTSA
jgi:hypothetical protein